MNWPDETDDEVIDRLWRARFGQPLPVMGSAALARKILSDWMAPHESESASPADGAALHDARRQPYLSASSQV